MANFFQLSPAGMPNVERASGDSTLSIWLFLQVFHKVLDAVFKPLNCSTPLSSPITEAESDIAHYIGGFVIHALKRKTKDVTELEVIETFLTCAETSSVTLAAAVSRGGLVQLAKEGKSLFVELEQVFRDLFPTYATSVDVQTFASACYNNEVIQDCFSSITYQCHNIKEQETVFGNLISLYFKVRVHHRCRNIVENLRRETKSSHKDRALRAKLAR